MPCCYYYFETRTYDTAQAGLKLTGWEWLWPSDPSASLCPVLGFQPWLPCRLCSARDRSRLPFCGQALLHLNYIPNPVFFFLPETGSHVFSLTWNALICLLLKSFGLSVWIENGSLDWDWWPWLDFNNFYFSLSLSLPLSHWENVLSGKSFERGFFGTLHV